MILQMHSIKFDADEKLLNLIQKKVDKLEIYYDRIVDGEVYLRLNNTRDKNKTVEIKLNIPGDQLFAGSSAKTFEIATDEAAEALKQQITRYKKRMEH